jgi:predicted peroxiredoxin
MISLLVEGNGVDKYVFEEMTDKVLSYRYKELKDNIMMLLIEETGHSLEFFEKWTDKALYSRYKKILSEDYIPKKSSDELKAMNFEQLKQHAKELRKEGYNISGISKLTNNSEDRKFLRKLIRESELAKEDEEEDEDEDEDEDEEEQSKEMEDEYPTTQELKEMEDEYPTTQESKEDEEEDEEEEDEEEEDEEEEDEEEEDEEEKFAKKSRSELKAMNFEQLKQHAKELRKKGYKISGISKLTNNSEDRKFLRKLIRESELEEDEEEEDEEEEEHEKEEEEEIKKVDIQKTIANIISNEKKIGGLAKAEKVAAKCFGLIL